MKEIKWLDSNQIQIEPPKHTRKCTGTRFATLLGQNPWSSPFEMFCAITKTYEVPFEDTKYTLAGKAIEPLQAQYIESEYGVKLMSPTDAFGKDYFKTTRGDFFPDVEIFGGMWDYLGLDEDGKPDSVFEMKTTKRIEDWADDIPEYYALQAALYAYWLGIDDVIMVASFLDEADYDHPEEYQCGSFNTIIKEFSLSERYPDFADKLRTVIDWWQEHIKTGISPEYDEKKDAEILEALRKNSLSPDTDIQDLLKEAEALKAEIDNVTAGIAEKEKRYKDVTNLIKEYAVGQFREGDKKVEMKGDTFTFTVARSESKGVDKKALEKDGLLEKYSTVTESYRLTVK